MPPHELFARKVKNPLMGRGLFNRLFDAAAAVRKVLSQIGEIVYM
jgi:hypothetical protein